MRVCAIASHHVVDIFSTFEPGIERHTGRSALHHANPNLLGGDHLKQEKRKKTVSSEKSRVSCRFGLSTHTDTTLAQATCMRCLPSTDMWIFKSDREWQLELVRE